MSARMRRRITTAKREEIEAEQKILENTIVRPFETLAGLPISYNEPPNGHYEDILKNPLTIKDSAVLYNSLIRSRSTYVYHAPMFKLHWVKQTAYAKKLAEMDKEKQKEILSDRENKRRFAKATTNSLEARTRTPVLSPEVNARDVMSKLCESSITLGPHTMDIRIFIAKDARSEKSRAISELSKVGGPITETSNTAKPTEDESANTKPNSVAPSAASPLETNKETKELPNTNERPQNTESKATEVKHEKPLDNTSVADSEKGAGAVQENVNKQQESVDVISSEGTAPSSKVPMDAVATPNTGGISSGNKDELVKNKNENLSTESNSGSEQSVALNSKDNPDSSAVTHIKDAPPVSNLSVSPKHPTSASPHIPHDSEKEPTSLAPQSTTKAQPTVNPVTSVPSAPSATSVPKMTPKTAPPPVVRPSPTNLQSIDNTIMISNLNAIAKIDLSLNDLMKEVALGKASEVQITRFKKYIERAKQMGPQPHHAELYFNRGLPLPPDFPRPFQARPVVEKKAPPKPKVFNPMKLTAFQERYLHNATLVFEFLENPNVRYIIPQDSICEVVKAELPVPQDAEPGTEYNDILISHLWIHNIDEMEKYEKDYANYETEVKKRKEEDERKQKEEETGESSKPEGELEAEKLRSKPESRSLRTKKKLPPQKKKKQPVPPEYPHIKYTAFSFTIHNIPSRFAPIFINSMKPLKQIQERMEHILKTGTRITSFYLWYQVDARLDEEFAENLRNTAVLEEKKMTGFLPPVEPKKRKPREYKNPRTKRPKEMSPATDQGPLPSTSGEAQAVVESSLNSEGVKPFDEETHESQNENHPAPTSIAESTPPSVPVSNEPNTPI